MGQIDDLQRGFKVFYCDEIPESAVSLSVLAIVSSRSQAKRLSLTIKTGAQILIGSVWVFHGLYSKILNGIPRHRLIVGKILGQRNANLATKSIGLLEVLLGIWAFTAWQPIACAAIQTCAIVAMNTLEICLAGELLISALGMVILNLGFLGLVWWWGLSSGNG
jgi:hypothetical protein